MDEEKNEVPSEQPVEQPAEQAPAAAPPPPPAKSAVPLAIVLILIVAVAVAAYVLVGVGKGWQPEAYMPKEVAVAVTVDLSTSSDKDAAIEFIRGVLKDAGVEKPEKDLFKEINQALKLDVEKDILPKLNGKGGFALLTETSAMTPEIVLVLGAKTPNDAKELAKLINSKIKEQGQSTEAKKYETYDYFRLNPMGMPAFLCVGAVENGVLCTLGETTFKTAVDIYKGKPSLLANSDYTRLRKSGSSTVGTMYYSGPGFYKLIQPYMMYAAAQMGPEASEQMKKGFERVVAAVGTATATGDGLGFQVTTVSKEQVPSMAQASVADLAKNLPASAAVAVVAPDVKASWSYTKKQMKSMYGSMDPLALVGDQVKAEIGFDPFTDILDNITSIEGYYAPKSPLPKSKFAGYAGVAMGVDKPALAAKTLAKINAAIAKSAGAGFKPLSVSGQKFSVGLIDKEGIRMADAVVKDKMLFAVTGSDPGKDAKAVIDSSKGKGASLAASERFKTVASQLPGRSTRLIYVDLKPIFESYKSEMSAKDAKIALKIVNKVGTVGISGSSSGKETEGYMVVPFTH